MGASRKDTTVSSMTTTTAGALDREDIGKTITVHLPGKHRTGQLLGIDHGRDRFVRLEVGRQHIVVLDTMPVTITIEITGD